MTFPRWIPALAFFALLDSPAGAQSSSPSAPGVPPSNNPSAAAPAEPPAWPVTSAPARFTFPTTPQTVLNRIGVVDLFLTDPNWINQPIRVYTDTGVAVASDLIWVVPNNPVQLAYDATTNAKSYRVYFGSNYPPMHLTDTKAGVWLESRAGDGQIVNNLPEMLKAWDQSTKVLGRTVVNGIWLGGNRFGPQCNLLTRFQAWIDLPVATHLQFAAISVDACFVLIDGKEVVEWPGRHDRWYGPSGPPQGAVDLAAGPHELDYYNAYVYEPGDNPMPITCTLNVKGGAFPDWTALTPDKPFFRPYLRCGSLDYNLQKDSPGAVTTGVAPPFAIGWTNGDQSIIYSDLADMGFISMHLFCMPPLPTGVITWSFDDGTTAQGPTVEHLFPRPGPRTVRVSVAVDGKETGTLTQIVDVHPDWLDPNKGPRLTGNHETDIMARDPTALSASDLAGCFAMFGHFLLPDDLFKFVPAMTAKMNDVTDADLPYVKHGALLLAREDWAHYAEEIQILRALLDRCGKGTPTPQTNAIASEVRLALARLLFKTTDKLDEARALLAAIDPKALTDREPRILQILNADLALAGGDVPGARKQYTDLTGEPTGPDARSSIRQIAKISQARAYIDRKDFDAAEDALNEVAWENPIEKLSPDWALTRLRLYQEENLPVIAYLWAKRLLPAISDTGRAELLYRTTELAFAQSDNDLAQKTLSELLKKHPYSEEAAQAKEKWPGKG